MERKRAKTQSVCSTFSTLPSHLYKYLPFLASQCTYNFYTTNLPQHPRQSPRKISLRRRRKEIECQYESNYTHGTLKTPSSYFNGQRVHVFEELADFPSLLPHFFTSFIISSDKQTNTYKLLSRFSSELSALTK